MAELLRLIVDLLGFLWPFRTVKEYQKGVQYCWGRYWRTVGPGVFPVVPYFMDIMPVDVQPAIYSTPLQTITLRDKSTLTFSATMKVWVEDPAKALNTVDHFPETTVELVSGLLSEQLADVDPDRFDPARGKRGRLLEELKDEADAETAKFGVRVQAIRLNNFAVGVRTYRLLGETATLPSTIRRV